MTPGLAPFASALSLPAWLCENCGFWQRFAGPPASCPLCLDARHVVPSDGWRFIALDDARGAYPTRAEEVHDGVWRFTNEPAPGIGPSGYVVCTDEGNVAFEGAAVFDEDALARIEALGGLRVISASHPHSYGALHQLQDRFVHAELALHPGDLGWSAALRVTWPFDDVLHLGGGLTLHHTGGHFAGHAVLHDARRSILFCGDALKFDLDPRDPRRALAISTHKAFVRAIPMTHGELRRYREVFARVAFGQTWTPFEQAANAGRDVALALMDRQLAGRPSAAPVPLEELR